MSQATKRPASRRVQTTIFRIVNVPMRALLGLPFGTPLGGRLMLLHLTGRKTGKRYRQPVSYVRDGDDLLTPGGGRWRLNLRDGEPVTIRLRGRDLEFRPELVSDPDEVERLLGVMAAANPSIHRFVRIPRTPDGSLDRASLATALRYGFRIVRWHPGASRP
jgi:deazaflavin-dependent oxidoreductase (nitroreductase family)